MTKIVGIFIGLLNLLEEMLPVIENLRVTGLITAAQQAEMKERYRRLKERADGQFSGPEWMIEP